MYDLNQASEIIKDSHFAHDSITTEQIKKEIKKEALLLLMVGKVRKGLLLSIVNGTKY